MRIVIILARFNIGGTARYIFELAKHLSNSGYQILLLVGEVQSGETEDPLLEQLTFRRIKRLGRKISVINDMLARLEIRKYVNSFKPDIIYSHTFKAGLLSRIGNLPGINIHAFHGHLFKDPEFTGIKKFIIVFVERFLAQKSSRIVVVGRKVSEELLAQKIGNSLQHTVIAPGINPLKLYPRQEARQLLGIQFEKRPIVVWMARVTGVKDPNKFIELAKCLPEAKFLLVGQGDLYSSLKVNLPENLSMLGWQMANTVWAVADICVSTSLNEGMPIALIEAQMAGVPVVALDTGSISEVVLNNQTGYVLSTFDSQFISKVRELILNPELRLSLSKSAELNAKMNFSVERMINLHDKLFRELRPPVYR